MVKEAYCSHEVAKLLREKGFDVPCTGRYSIRSEEFHLDATRLCNNGGMFQVAAPTHQMAMGWLREIHLIFIEISVSVDLNCDYHYSYSVLNKKCEYVRKIYPSFNWSYEEAVEAALKYVLENLI